MSICLYVCLSISPSVCCLSVVYLVFNSLFVYLQTTQLPVGSAGGSDGDKGKKGGKGKSKGATSGKVGHVCIIHLLVAR